MNNYYIVFSSSRQDESFFKKYNLDLIRIAEICLSELSYRRLFGNFFSTFSKQIDFKRNVYGFVVDANTDKANFLFNGAVLNRKGSKAVEMLLVSNHSFVGCPDLLFSNICLTLLDIFSDSSNACITSLLGENGWKSLYEYFVVLKKINVEYVVLRKFEKLPFSFIDGDKDLDVLTNDRALFCRISNALKRSIGISGYKIKVGDSFVALDVRFVGDNYFDPIWAVNAIHSRTTFQEIVYIMDDINYIFSVAYHVLTQKENVSLYYRDLIFKMFKNLFHVDNDCVESDETICCYLVSFMTINGYKYCKPVDVSVVQNKKWIKRIKAIKFYPSKKKIQIIGILTKIGRYSQKMEDYVNALD